MTCTQCGANLSIGTKFCDRCGTAQPEFQSAQPPAQHQAATPSLYQQAPPPPGSPPPAPMNYYQPQQNTPPQYQQYQPNPNPYPGYPAQVPHIRKLGTPGGKMIMIVSILFLVFGGMNTFSLIIAYAMSGFWDALAPGYTPFTVLPVVSFLIVLYDLFIGIFGLKYREHLDKSVTLIVLGIVNIALLFVAIFISISTLSDMPYMSEFASLGFDLSGLVWATAIFGLAFWLPLPILYIVGANKNRKAFTA